jgi:crotonobetainyl-CoA:carnitine CoA-transferase CaiB-like acyl-CoA transferase
LAGEARNSRCSALACLASSSATSRAGFLKMTRPFSGTRILDFTQVLAGPYGSYQLALLGADVIKVERREGEDMRRTPLSREWAERGMAPSWLAINGNKRSLTLDLQNPAAKDVIRRLAAKSDVVMENFRPGVMDRLGLGYAALCVVNPRLIYCAISGFGQSGPYRDEAGYDGKIQALSGIMSLTGHKEMGPTRAGFAVCDVLSGMTAAFAVSSALFQRAHTGQGQFIDVSMLEASLAFLSTQVADFTVAGHRQEQFGNQAISRKVTANLFRAKNSYLLLAVNNDRQYEALMRAIGRDEVLDDPRFGDWFQRKENETALRTIIEDAGGRGCQDLGETAERCRRTLREYLADRGSHQPSADRRAERDAGCRDPIWVGAPDGLGIPDGARRRPPRHRAAGTWRAHRGSAARSWLLR